MMMWPATSRHGMESAPGSLGLVQDLINTAAFVKPRDQDLLTDLAQAQAWVDAAASRWSALVGQVVDVVLDTDGMDNLRAFRDDLQELMAYADVPAPGTRPIGTASLANSAAALQFDEAGTVHLEARGTGWRRLASMALIALYEAQLADTRRRLKVCRNPRCRAAFFDRSRNNSGVWHDVKRCGNAANLRAYRARRRTEPPGA